MTTGADKVRPGFVRPLSVIPAMIHCLTVTSTPGTMRSPAKIIFSSFALFPRVGF
jgi:hypothetical protein